LEKIPHFWIGNSPVFISISEWAPIRLFQHFAAETFRSEREYPTPNFECPSQTHGHIRYKPDCAGQAVF
jgi:hypothetical protein